jgi:hypothetical protein
MCVQSLSVTGLKEEAIGLNELPSFTFSDVTVERVKG